MAARKQRRQVSRVGDGPLLFAAVGHEFGEETSCGAAERVADDVDFDEITVRVPSAPLREKGLCIGGAVPLHAVLFRMCFAVVHRAAEQLCIDFAAAVPRRGEGTHGRCRAGHAHLFKHDSDVRIPEAEIREHFAGDLLLSESEHAMQQQNGIPVLLICHLFSLLFIHNSSPPFYSVNRPGRKTQYSSHSHK